MNTEIMIEKIQSGEFDSKLLDVYVDDKLLDYQKSRYVEAIRRFEEIYEPGEAKIFSAPGRSEVGGNHTDHQHGTVLAASINLDSIGIVRATNDNVIRLVSDEYEEIVISLDDILLKQEEKETTTALIKGVVSGFLNRQYGVGGFSAFVTSDVLIGAGLSSSAAFESLIGTILSGLYNNMSVSAIDIAIIGQYAENIYFGKPCGLMDQMACSVGNLVYIDFENPSKPIVEKVEVDMEQYGYSLCITDTKGSHADLTDEYAAVPKEMKLVAKHFGQDVLRGITAQDILKNIVALRSEFGDRSVLRALHFVNENERVGQEVTALKKGDFEQFLYNVKASGDSSYKYLQNVYANSDVNCQNVSVALATSDVVLGENGVSRVHGGGFAGTIQAFVKNSHVDEYKKNMDLIFGAGSCSDLRIRKYGGIQII
ncbi:MAG: galactokinase [Lachnospiraceae bacterium]|nr:galactokinase [Lachnospiraceae bacterium]